MTTNGVIRIYAVAAVHVLRAVAALETTITYSQLLFAISGTRAATSRRNLGRILLVANEICLNERYPHLTTLAVYAVGPNKGRCSREGMASIGVTDEDMAREQCYQWARREKRKTDEESSN